MPLTQETFRSLSSQILDISEDGLEPRCGYWWMRITKAYSEPQRKYHTMKHIRSMWESLDEIEDTFGLDDETSGTFSEAFGLESGQAWSTVDSHIVRLAILFHDIVYDPLSNINEEQSILVFLEFAKDFVLPDTIQTQVVSLIRATIRHTLPADSFPLSLPLFLDLDLEVLSRARTDYDKYRTQIRQEYIYFDDAQFNSGRRGVLQKLGKGAIYFTPWWKMNRTNAAKENIEWEINMLDNAPNPLG